MRLLYNLCSDEYSTYQSTHFSQHSMPLSGIGGPALRHSAGGALHYPTLIPS